MSAFSQTVTADHTLIFFHIPKTAGATLAQIFTRQYAPQAHFHTEPERHWASIEQFKQLSAAERKRYRAISGHMAFGVHEWLPQPYSYITLLRDPIERIISYYYFILHYPGHYLYEKITGQQMSLQDVLNSGISKEFDNLQTRLLSGTPKIDYGQCSTAMLTAANYNLATHFRFVGTTKKFDEFLVLVSQAYGWQSPFYVKKHVIKNRPRRHEIPRETLKTIEQYHELDLALYERIEQNFAQLIEDQGDALQRAVKRFQWLNNAYTYSYPVLHKIRRVQERLAA